MAEESLELASVERRGESLKQQIMELVQLAKSGLATERSDFFGVDNGNTLSIRITIETLWASIVRDRRPFSPRSLEGLKKSTPTINLRKKIPLISQIVCVSTLSTLENVVGRTVDTPRIF
jgi:hypothetical protein